LSKFENVNIVLEGFLILLAAHFLGSEFITRAVLTFYPNTPLLTAAIIGSSNISALVAVIYMALRSWEFPAAIVGPHLITGAVGGVVLSWLVTFLLLVFYEGIVPYIKDVLSLPAPYKYHGIVSIVLWSPLIEELMARGFFFELLKRRWGLLYATLGSTFLFVLAHAIWGGFGFSLFILSLYSFAFTFAYVQSGLFGSVVSHVFVNAFLAYLTYVNS
jgi:membrane protease YdiL (CAAX protease family)